MPQSFTVDKEASGTIGYEAGLNGPFDVVTIVKNGINATSLESNPDTPVVQPVA
jgi:hypothetical protein